MSYFFLIPDEIKKFGKLTSIWDDEVEYVDFNPSQKYAYKIQLQKFIHETNETINRMSGGMPHPDIKIPSRNELLKRLVPDGDCVFINQTILSIKTHFKKNNLSLDKFLVDYPNHKIIFEQHISNYEKISYIYNKYEEIELDINLL